MSLPRSIEAAFLCDVTEQKNTPISAQERTITLDIAPRSMQSVRVVVE
jgi:hypothetical protein